jgi:hypothetical protein
LQQEDIFSEVFDGAVDHFFDPSEPSEEDQQFHNEEIDVNPAIRTDMDNLLTNGFISTEVELAGHVFAIRTLTIGEELAVALVAADYDKNYAQHKAVAVATVAAALETIDGRTLMQSLGPDPATNIRQKFLYIKNKWYWAIIEELYRNYLFLLERQIQAFRDLKGK